MSNAIPSRLFRPERCSIFCESESDCTSETRAGQFSIFGAVEEKDCGDFSGTFTDEATAEERELRC